MDIQGLAKELRREWLDGDDLEYLAKFVAVKILEARIEEIKLYRQLIDNGYRHNRIAELEKQKQELTKGE